MFSGNSAFFVRSTAARYLLGLTALTAIPQAAADDESPATYEEVVVTARYLAESAQDLPFSVSVLDGETLDRARLYSIEDALRSSVGVDVSSFGGFNDTNVRMRGVGSLFQINGEDSSVVMNVDGVPLSARSATLATMDIERVEILKGPQGTLFGRNSEAGAINITTRRPSQLTEGHVSASAGEEGQYVVEGALGGALLETLSARIAIRAAGADSVVHSAQNNNPVLEAEDLGWRTSFLWQPAEATSLLLVAEQQDQEGRNGLEVLQPWGDPPTQNVPPGVQFGENDQERYSLEINHDFSDFRFTSLTSRTSNDTDARGCQSSNLAFALYGVPADVCQDVHSEYDTLNQDFRLTALTGSEVFWVAGVNGSRIERRYDNGVLLFGNSAEREFETRSAAVYGEVSYPFAQRWSVTAGARFTSEEKDYDGFFFFMGVPTGEDHRDLSDDYWTGRIALAFEVSEEVNIYGVVARGYKTGGYTDFTSQVADGEPLEPATVESIELGVKGSINEGRFSFTGALFFNEVEDDHLLGFDPATFAAQGLNTDTESQGVEVEGSWLPNENWTFSLGLGYTDAEIKSSVVGASGGDVQAGNSVPDVAPWNGLMRVNYVTPLPDFLGLASPELDVLLTYRYLDERPGNPQNQFELDSNEKLDAQIMLRGSGIELSLWGDNLLNDRNDLYGYFYGPGLVTGAPTRERTVGATVSYRF